MAQKLSMKPNSEQLLELQRVFGQDSPEFKAIIQDLASDKTPQERELDRFFKQHERAFDKRNPQFIKGRSPQSDESDSPEDATVRGPASIRPKKSLEQLEDSFYRALRQNIRGKNNQPKLDEIADQIVKAGGKAKEGFGRAAAQQKILDQSARGMAIDQLAEEYGQAMGRAKGGAAKAGVQDTVKNFANDAANKIRNLEFDKIGTESIDNLRRYSGQQDELTRIANAMAGTPKDPLGRYALDSAEAVAERAGRLGKIFRNQGGTMAADLFPAIARRGAGVVGGSALGLLDPFAEEAHAPGGKFFDILNQQAATLGGPAINPDEIAAMMDEFNSPTSPAPEMETYSAMDVEISPKKKGMKSSTRSKTVPKKNADVEMIAQEYSAPAASPAFQQGVQNWSRQNPEMDFTETLLDELTASGSPVRRGSLPKRQKKNPGIRKSY